MSLSYEKYMNLVYNLNYINEPVPKEIARKIVSNAVSPVVTVTSTNTLDGHIYECYKLDSLYMLLRYFGDCITDRDQSEEHIRRSETGRVRSNSVFLRDSPQFIRFTRPLPDLIGTRNENDLLFDYHSLEVFLANYLDMVDAHTTWETPHSLLQHSTYHKFFTAAISSNSYLSPYESFNHPVVSLLAIDVARGENYDDARDLLIHFKNLHNSTPNFPTSININDILPVFLLCYDENSRSQFELCQALVKTLKKQLFVESILLPLWKYPTDIMKSLHQPIMSSLDENMLLLVQDNVFQLPLELINNIYDRVDILTNELMVPFMKRKISFWDETILQPRKSIFQNSKLFRRLMPRNNMSSGNNRPVTVNRDGVSYFSATSNEFLLRKLADWSFMLGDFKVAYGTYDLLSRDLENHFEYLASCLEWCALSVLMGAQSIVTVKMIKNDIDPLINRALKSYEFCALKAKDKKKTKELANANGVTKKATQETYSKQQKTLSPQSEPESEGPTAIVAGQPAQSYETRCMLLAAELFLSLSDTWTATPYAIKYLETILDECALGSLSKVLIWERLAYCYALRVDPRVSSLKAREILPTNPSLQSNVAEVQHVDEKSDSSTEEWDSSYKIKYDNIAAQGLSRRRKSALFELIAARKWSTCRQWKRASWCFQDIDQSFEDSTFAFREGLIIQRLQNLIEIHEGQSLQGDAK
ncbi:LAMI_0H15390g1_1 [Lachancea mirantina]|uniref:LAMI_0H15390g1_1 n=1 Tax=Lachancea mirantina TaxID=1230905 RepID=A0A1G4KIV6_9SACH|nr:LAMI_0H15390g1_1 [Lachancea mirantina]